MLSENLAKLYERDILKLKAEIGLYTKEELMWQTAPGISNSGGNLCLHLLGNLQHYIGAVLGKSGYVRNRPLEFSSKHIPRTDMLLALEHTALVVTQTIRSLPVQAMETEYPEQVFDYPMTTGYYLLHTLAHLNYHLGQINYHRRMVCHS